MAIYTPEWTPPRPESKESTRGRRRWYGPKGSGRPWLDERIVCCTCPHISPRLHDIRRCGRWSCPLHGYYPRLEKARELLGELLPADDQVVLGLVVHLNQPADGPMVTRVVDIARKTIGRVLERAGVRGELVAAAHHELKGEGHRARVHEHVHFALSLPVEAVSDPVAVRAELERCAGEIVGRVRRRGRTVDSRTAKRITAALADPANVTTMPVNAFVDEWIEAVRIPERMPRKGGRYKKVFGRRRQLGGTPQMTPRGKRGIGDVIRFCVTIGRRIGMGDDAIRAKTEAAVKLYRECCAKAGMRAVGWRTWENTCPCPETAARATAYYEGFLPAGLPLARHAPRAEFAPGDWPGAHWKTWTGIEPWVRYTLRVRKGVDELDPEGHPPIGQRHRLFYGPHAVGGTGRGRRTPRSPTPPPGTPADPPPHSPPTDAEPAAAGPSSTQAADAASGVDGPTAALAASVEPWAVLAWLVGWLGQLHRGSDSCVGAVGLECEEWVGRAVFESEERSGLVA